MQVDGDAMGTDMMEERAPRKRLRRGQAEPGWWWRQSDSVVWEKSALFVSAAQSNRNGLRA